MATAGTSTIAAAMAAAAAAAVAGAVEQIVLSCPAMHSASVPYLHGGE